MEIIMRENEYWWGGAVCEGHNMPYGRESKAFFDLNGSFENDQFAPVFLSSLGRYVWSERPFTVKIENGKMDFCGAGDFVVSDGHENLKGAYMAAMKKHFPFTGKMPDRLFFKMPQYNTWIELGTEQTTENILSYAKSIVDSGMPPGVFMIDGGWQEDYGYFDFNRRKVPDPKYLTDSLHNMGFKVMLWVSPIVASAGARFKELRSKGFLVNDSEGSIAVRSWWSGYSAVLDFTNPEAVDWFHSKLDRLMDIYGIDGFKFDAGDRGFYRDDDMIYKPMLAREHTGAFNDAGERYSFNEFRAAYKRGGRPIVARLHDKYHSWNDRGLNTLIPHTILQGLCGYAYCCPDMVGGGILDCFAKGAALDGELFVRWAQTNALMGMMQLSVSSKRVLKPENFALATDAVKLRMKYSDYITELAEKAALSGEPIVRHMAYEFPGEGFETVNDQFMLGGRILAAPVLEKGKSIKNVRLPKGQWKAKDGKLYSGGSYKIPSPLEDGVLYFEKIK